VTPARAWKVDDVAAFLRINHRTVIKMAERGDIPCVRLGKLYRFDPQKIVALFDDVAR
jgi:excisionase family DNA binding protein